MIYKKQNQNCTYTFKNISLNSSPSSHKPCGCRDFCDFPPKQNCKNSCCDSNCCWNNSCNNYHDQNKNQFCNNWQNCPCFDNCSPNYNPCDNWQNTCCPKNEYYCPQQNTNFNNCNISANDFRYFLIGYLIGGIN